jgi:DNA-binding Xre family transcriptional regulator
MNNYRPAKPIRDHLLETGSSLSWIARRTGISLRNLKRIKAGGARQVNQYTWKKWLGLLESRVDIPRATPNGPRNAGNKHHAKLTMGKARTIRAWSKKGWTSRELAHRYGVSRGIIVKILSGDVWKEAEDEKGTA